MRVLKKKAAIVAIVLFIVTRAIFAQTLVLKPDQMLDTILGIGGNYCFQIEHSTTRYTLDSLKPTIARTEMTLSEWEPENDNNDPNTINWNAVKAKDSEGSNLRLEFNLMKELNAKKVPYVISIWNNPSWISGSGQEVSQTKWDELIESICSYLLYAKETYGGEPDWFSFNESDYGICVKFTSKNHLEFIGRLGEKMESSGLKTRCLLGDVGKASDGWSFVKNFTGLEPQMKYATAVSFHSWRGNNYARDTYPLWREFATKLKKPLFVAETGPDPTAHSGAKYASFDYGILEMVHYMQLFMYARPQGMMQWEFTGDYDLLANGNPETERFAYFKHWIRFARPGSFYLATEGGTDDLLFAAFGDPKNKRLAMHCATPSSSGKTATITGIPAPITSLKVVCTERGKLYREKPEIAVSNGSAVVALPAKSVTTLWANYEFPSAVEKNKNTTPLMGNRNTLLIESVRGGIRFRHPGKFSPENRFLIITDLYGRVIWKSVFSVRNARQECIWGERNHAGQPVRPGTYIADAGGGLDKSPFMVIR